MIPTFQNLFSSKFYFIQMAMSTLGDQIDFGGKIEMELMVWTVIETFRTIGLREAPLLPPTLKFIMDLMQLVKLKLKLS